MTYIHKFTHLGMMLTIWNKICIFYVYCCWLPMKAKLEKCRNTVQHIFVWHSVFFCCFFFPLTSFQFSWNLCHKKILQIILYFERDFFLKKSMGKMVVKSHPKYVRLCTMQPKIFGQEMLKIIIIIIKIHC